LARGKNTTQGTQKITWWLKACFVLALIESNWLLCNKPENRLIDFSLAAIIQYVICMLGHDPITHSAKLIE